jgi:uncharacterized protein (DUF927 family)
MTADATLGAPAFIPSEKELDGLYALGFAPQDVFAMEREAAADILARRETKTQREARLKPKTVKDKAAKGAKTAAGAPPLGPSPTAPEADEEKAAMRLWSRAGSPIVDVVERYFASRGLDPLDNPAPGCLRFVPNLKHGPSEEFRPALVLHATHEKTGADLCGVQRIYLEIGGKGKAKFRDASHRAEMALGDVAKGVIRLGDFIPGKPLVIVEGFEDGATIWQATGLPVVVALGASRIKSFTPTDDCKWLLVGAQNDKANKDAVKALCRRMEKLGVRVDVAAPPPGTADARIKDFNDLINGRGPFERKEGLRLTCEIIERAMAGKEAGANKGQIFSMSKNGLFRHVGGNEWDYVSQSFEVLGLTRSAAIDGRMSGWGRLIRFDNPDKTQTEEVVPASALHEDPAKIAATLADLGFKVDATSQARRNFVQYLNRNEAEARITLASRTGWVAVGGERAFIVPGVAIGGDPNERVLLAKEINAPYSQRGTLDEWREHVAKPACDHLMLRFAIGVSLGGVLISLVNGESGVFHIYGPSSAGKTTASRVAASAWGSGADGAYVRTWRATSNALESVLAASSDSLLVLDEIGQVDPREIAQVVYMISSARGKDRMTRTATIRSTLKWRTLVLSNGEVPIAARLNEDSSRVGRRGARAGHLVRAIDVRAHRTHGVFDHAYPDFNAEAFADQMKEAASRYYGTLGPEFVRRLLDHGAAAEAIVEKVDAFVALALEDVSEASGQVKRVAQRFALVAAAGELAVEFGLVPWKPGVAAADGVTLFRSWLAARGGAGQIEDRQMIGQVQRFWELHGESRFDNLDDPPKNPFTGQEMKERPSAQRAGYREGEGDDRRWYVFPQLWRDEICVGFDAREVARLLARLEILEKGDGKHIMKRMQIGPGARSRFYVMTPKIFEGWAEQDEARNGADEDDE